MGAPFMTRTLRHERDDAAEHPSMPHSLTAAWVGLRDSPAPPHNPLSTPPKLRPLSSHPLPPGGPFIARFTAMSGEPQKPAPPREAPSSILAPHSSSKVRSMNGPPEHLHPPKLRIPQKVR